MAEVEERKRKGQKGGTDVNQNKAKPPTPLNMKELAREKIRQQMKGPAHPAVKEAPKSKSKRVKVGQAPTRAAPLIKGKSYKSSLDRNVAEKDPTSDVLKKKFVKDTKAGGRSNTGQLAGI